MCPWPKLEDFFFFKVKMMRSYRRGGGRKKGCCMFLCYDGLFLLKDRFEWKKSKINLGSAVFFEEKGGGDWGSWVLVSDSCTK